MRDPYKAGSPSQPAPFVTEDIGSDGPGWRMLSVIGTGFAVFCAVAAYALGDIIVRALGG